MARPPLAPEEKLGEQIYLRLDAETEHQIIAVATEYGLNKSTIIRLLIKTFLQNAIKNGKVVLPRDWSKLMEDASGLSMSKSDKNVIKELKAKIELMEKNTKKLEKQMEKTLGLKKSGLSKE